MTRSNELIDEKPHIDKWPALRVSGAKRANIMLQEPDSRWDWFVGYGKDESCQFEGSWWDMICLARNILASENTRLAAPEFYMPYLGNGNYTSESPYTYADKE